MLLFDLVLGLFVIPVAVFALLARKRGRQWAGAWLLTIAPLYIPLGEDGFLAVWLTVASPTMDPHGMSGLVHPHAAGHVLGAGVAAIVLGIVASWIARLHLATGAPWAWRVLMLIGLPVVAVGLVELVWFFGHGLPMLADHQGGFGWPFWFAGILAWGVGLVMARPCREATVSPRS